MAFCYVVFCHAINVLKDLHIAFNFFLKNGLLYLINEVLINYNKISIAISPSMSI